MRSIVTAKGKSRSVYDEHVADGQEGKDVYRYQSFYHRGFWNVYYFFPRKFEVSQRYSSHPSTKKARAALLFECLSWWPPDDDSIPPDLDDRPFFLGELMAKESGSVRPRQERVGGRWCHVVEFPKLETVWIDSSEMVMVKRERRDTHTGLIKATYELSDYRPVVPGILLPYRIHRILWSPDIDSVIQVIRYETNSVSERDFEFRPGPGSIVHDRDTETWTQVPGGLDCLDQISDYAKQQLTSSSTAKGSTLAGPFMPLFGLVACTALLPWISDRIAGMIRALCPTKGMINGPLEAEGQVNLSSFQ